MRFSLVRVGAMLKKEFLQLARDRVSMTMLVIIPLMQLTLFGFGINLNPRDLPTAISINDPGIFSRSVVAALNNSGYFKIVYATHSPALARRQLQEGKVLFVVEIPANFTRDIVRGSRPELLIEVDATDPASGSYALAAFSQLAAGALRDDLNGPLAARAAAAPPFTLVPHLLYNPESITAYNSIPGLIALILTMNLVMMTSMAITCERERGTYENLLAMPVTPLEVMLGKIVPNVAIGIVQAALVLMFGRLVFGVPMLGSWWLLWGTLLVFIAANLAVGYAVSTMARSAMQAIQLANFFQLPSLLLSGFMFPFLGMPAWARWIGDLLPATHFLRIVRGILLKNNNLAEIWPNLWPLLVFTLVVSGIAVLRYRRTLD